MSSETKPVVDSTPAVAPVAEAPVLGDVIETPVAPTTTEPLKEEAPEKQPTTTHAESGTAHTDSEAATKVDGTPAAVPTETVEETKTPAVVAPAPAAETSSKTVTVEDPKEDKKTATKEKIEKTKSEGKGFFAKFFGAKKEAPKKPKVKTPKAEKADPIAATSEETTPAASTETPAETAAESSAAPAEVTGAAITTDTAEPAPAHAEAPAVPTMDTKPEADVVKETEIPVAPVETVPASTSETKVEEPVAPVTAPKDEPPRGVKATRRLSARFTSFVHKIGGKKDGATTPKEEKDLVESKAESSSVADEAPQLDKPTPAEPLKIEEPKTTTAAPPAAPVVSTAA